MPVQLDSLDDKDKPVKRRLKTADAAFKIFTSFLEADKDAAWNRRIVHRWTAGESPLDQADLEAAGMGWNSNVNSLRASADREQAVSSFNNLATSVPYLCAFTTKYGKEEERAPWCEIMAEEYDWLLKEHWSSFYSHRQKTADAFITDGLGVCYWPDDRDWRFEIGRLGEFLFPTDADVDETKQDIVLFVEDYSFSQLVSLLNSDKKVREAKDKSFIDSEAVIEAIKDSAKEDSTLNRLSGDAFLEEIENNGCFYDYAKSQKIKLVHYYVKEASGKVTHSIGRADGKNKVFLQDRYEAYPCMQDVFVFYADGIGSWKLGSLKGQIYKALPLYMRQDVLLNKMDDHTMLALMIWLKSKTAAGKELFSQLTLGSLSILPEGIEFAKAEIGPNMSGAAQALMAQYAAITANSTGGYQQHAISPEGGDRTASEVNLQAASSASLSTAKLGNYYQSDDKLHKNVVSRLQRKNWISIDNGYEGYIEFRSRVEKRGVPWEAFEEASVKAIRAIGYGSLQQQTAAFQTLRGLIQYMSPEEQLNLAKDMAAALPGVGYDKISRYLNSATPKTPNGTREALDEHSAFTQGYPRPVFPDDPHVIHAEAHAGFIDATLQFLHDGQVDLPTAVKYLSPSMPHQKEHLDLAAKDPTKQDILKKLHAQFGGHMATFEKLQEQMQKQAQEQQQAPQGQPTQPDPSGQIDVAKAQAEIERDNAEAQARIARQDAESASRIQARTTQTAASVHKTAITTAANVAPVASPVPQVIIP